MFFLLVGSLFGIILIFICCLEFVFIFVIGGVNMKGIWIFFGGNDVSLLLIYVCSSEEWFFWFINCIIIFLFFVG